MASSPKFCLSDSTDSECDSPCDSEEYYENGIRGMNKEEEEQYYRALEKSEGFDVPTFPESCAFGLIVPVCDIPLTPGLRVCTEEAIKHYNNENGTNFEIVEIVKANQQGACGILYFITFEAKQIGTPPEYPTTTFQARVLFGILHKIEVKFCRQKPSS